MPDAAPAGETRARRADFERNLQRIVDAATTVLGDDTSASMSEIARASGLGRATLYRHFPTRDDLLVAILRRAFEHAEEAIAAAEPQRGSASKALGRVIDALAVIGDRYRVISTANSVDHLLDAELMQRAIDVFEPVKVLVERGQREGSVRDDLAPQWLTAALVALVNESARAVDRGDVAPGDAASVVRRTLLEPVATRTRRRGA